MPGVASGRCVWGSVRVPRPGAWLCLTLLLWPGLWLGWVGTSSAFAQAGGATGQVVQVGFEGMFRPSGWVPVRVRIEPGGTMEAGLYRLRVHQRDPDADEVIFERTIAVSPGRGGQEFWTYFRPEAVRGGFTPMSLHDTAERLRVVVADEEGVELFPLPVSRPVMPLVGDLNVPDRRLIVVVGGESGGFFPGLNEYGPGNTLGLSGEPAVAPVTVADLPDRAIGYEGVSAVVWQDADPTTLASDTLEALREWVAAGGHLVVVGQSHWQTLDPLADMLPVRPTTTLDLASADPLAAMAMGAQNNPSGQAWATLSGPFRYVIGDIRPPERGLATHVERWVPDGRVEGGRFPLLARRGYGFGCVTWLALDLTDRRLVGRGDAERQTRGWSAVWRDVFFWGDRPVLDPTDADRDAWTPRASRDLGASRLEGTRMAGRGLLLVQIAIVFVLAYWALAGPGLYFWLARRKRAHLSWFAFGLAAAAAALATVGVVRLVLRGPPQMRHVSVVRQGPVAPQQASASLGLYIPRDGVQQLVVHGGLRGSTPRVGPPAIEPGQRQLDGRRARPVQYVVPLDPPDPLTPGLAGLDGAVTAASIPYRSTLKKFDFDWTGPSRRGIDGDVALDLGPGLLRGSLVNATGHNLRNVYLVFRHPRAGRAHGGNDLGGVWIVYVPSWTQNARLDDFAQRIGGVDDRGRRRARLVGTPASDVVAPPTDGVVHGSLAIDWATYWFGPLRGGGVLAPGSELVNDWNDSVPRTIPMLSLFEALPPMRSAAVTGDNARLLRRGAHTWDATPAVTAGNLLVIAEAVDVASPVPLRVQNRPVEGNGRTIFQVVLPLERPAPTIGAADDAEQDTPEDADPAAETSGNVRD